MRYSALLVAFCVAIALLGPGSSVAAQAPANTSGDWVVPRTPDGRPDLQGNWSNATLTPFERRGGLGTQNDRSRRLVGLERTGSAFF